MPPSIANLIRHRPMRAAEPLPDMPAGWKFWGVQQGPRRWAWTAAHAAGSFPSQSGAARSVEKACRAAIKAISAADPLGSTPDPFGHCWHHCWNFKGVEPGCGRCEEPERSCAADDCYLTLCIHCDGGVSGG